ncbi:MAG TPA: hypothetical protein EYP04_10245 [Anaerolineae bacterium]|nr:hypothetical protein [Anaerolineae bacterium]
MFAIVFGVTFALLVSRPAPSMAVSPMADAVIAPLRLPVTLTLDAPAHLQADGRTRVLLQATLLDENRNPVPDGTIITFTVEAGYLILADDQGQELGGTTRNGIATVTWTAPTLLGTANVTATADSLVATATVRLARWSPRAPVPQPVGLGGRIACADPARGGDGAIWAVSGDASRALDRFDIATGRWERRHETPEGIGLGGGLAFGGNGQLYARAGTLGAGFWRYNIATDTWQPLADFPDFSGDGGALACTPNSICYALAGGGRSTFYRYNAATDTWERRADLPMEVAGGGALAAVSDAIYAFGGRDRPDFFRYDPSTDAWIKLADAPAAVGSGASLAWDGDSHIYALRGQAQPDLWRYHISTDRWERLLATPFPILEGGSLAFVSDPAGGFALFATRGGRSSDFWHYRDLPYVPGPAAGLALIAAPAELVADGISTSTLTAIATDLTGDAVADGTPITFTTDMGELEDGNASVVIPTLAGLAQAMLTAASEPGQATVTAQTSDLSATVQVRLTVGPPASIGLAIVPPSLPADGVSIAWITATIRDALDRPVADGTQVIFQADLGSFDGSLTLRRYSVHGTAVAQLTSGQTAGTAHITVTAGLAVATTTVPFLPGPPAQISVTIHPDRLPADGHSTAVVTATVRDGNGNRVADGTLVTFTFQHLSTKGARQGVVPTRDGTAITTYTAETRPGVARIIAEAGSAIGWADLELFLYYAQLPLIIADEPSSRQSMQRALPIAKRILVSRI